MHPAVAALPFAEKGLVLGALLARMPPETFAARFPGAPGSRVALEALGAESRSARASTLAALISLVRAPVPAGVERIHPGWLRERLAPESSAVVRAVTEGLPPEVRRIGDQLLAERGDGRNVAVPPAAISSTGSSALSSAGAAELRRRLFAGLVPLGELGAPTGPVAGPLMALSFAALEEAIERRGAAILGLSLRGAEARVIARAAANLGGRLAEALLDAASGPGPVDARDNARRLVERVAAEKPVDLVAHLGGRDLAMALGPEGPDAAQAVAQRLPPPLGRRLLAFVAEATE